MRRFRELLDGGYVGRPSRVQLTFRFPQWPRHWQRVRTHSGDDYHDDDDEAAMQSAWVGESKEGGPLREVGTHFFFALLELFPSDPPKRVQAHIKVPFAFFFLLLTLNFGASALAVPGRPREV